MQLDKNETRRSSLSQSFHQGGITVQVEIYQMAWSGGWTPELVHTDGGWTIWLAEFATDEAALAEFTVQTVRTGLRNLIAGTPLLSDHPLTG
ncbi:MAG: hypothetical protein J0I54_02725 [Bosea sp.]|uniref:hypothetical protein n=1 Tax=unclassified Bosea (in: a-proteobacteria) TaxID=2653178 RepID=UPI000961599F|nr:MULTISPECIES: hypothetical protein [unclassified Bosea (in: a-proteobacteria)]MBN9455522.1 hypothetical protein [Bosea sp. (in: a-proteobacteria)]OJV05110.1 MAG: hypothetical protein BGO20_18500 [Bosea sp. 67-29]